jgi:hypothetical protein
MLEHSEWRSWADGSGATLRTRIFCGRQFAHFQDLGYVEKLESGKWLASVRKIPGDLGGFKEETFKTQKQAVAWTEAQWATFEKDAEVTKK